MLLISKSSYLLSLLTQCPTMNRICHSKEQYNLKKRRGEKTLLLPRYLKAIIFLLPQIVAQNQRNFIELVIYVNQTYCIRQAIKSTNHEASFKRTHLQDHIVLIDYKDTHTSKSQSNAII